MKAKVLKRARRPKKCTSLACDNYKPSILIEEKRVWIISDEYAQGQVLLDSYLLYLGVKNSSDHSYSLRVQVESITKILSRLIKILPQETIEFVLNEKIKISPGKDKLHESKRPKD